MSAPFAAQAALYAPGETLDPACAPTDLNCGIEAQVGTGTTGQVPYYAADGSVLTATSSPGMRSLLGLSYASNTNVANNLNIATWGDSLTAGSGGTPYPTQLATLSGYTVYNGGVGGETSTQIKVRLLAATSKHGQPTIIWAGRNNYSDPTTVKADVAAMVAALGHENYIILGVLNGSYGGYEIPGGDGYIQITQLNSDLATLYGSHFIDIRAYLVSQYDSGQAQDVIDHTNDTPPTSLRSDAIHLNTAGYLKVAQKIYDNIYLLQSGTQTSLTPGNIQYFFSNPPTIGAVTPGLAYFTTAVVNTKLGVGSTTPTDMVSITVPNTANANSGITLDRNSGQNAFGFRLKSNSSGSYRGALIGKRNGSSEIEPLTVGLDTNYGNIGIGTTTPNAQLTVTSYLHNGLNLDADTGGTASSTRLFFTTSGGTYSAFANPNGLNFAYGATIGSNSGTTGLIMNSSGNIGIGTSSPMAAFSLNSGQIVVANGSGAAPSYSFATSPNDGMYIAAAGQLGLVTGGSERLRINSSAVSYQGSASGPQISLTGSSATVPTFVPNRANTTSGLGGTSGTLSLITGSTERIKVDSAGNVGVASTTPWRTFSVNGTVAFNGLTSSATGNAVCITTAKDITDAGGASCVPSSIRFKENVETLPQDFALNELNKLRVVSFDYKPGFYSPEDAPGSYGLIAEEVEDIDPLLVDYGYDGQPLTLRFDKLLGLAIQAIQNLSEKIDGFAQSFTSERVKTNTLCLDDVCITKNELQNLLNESNQPNAPAPDEPTPPSDEEQPSDTVVVEEPVVEQPPEEEPAPADESVDAPAESDPAPISE